ncbi:hypothetical protein AAFF_G00122240 [Aldrovandia affinis]|uniref:Uncharacterized protein n=1 Tax=Aldrovandia affinis TaxID=143900 RepID=A0AAD7WAW0_9TELE|nr:hypothetical protein AAFF_G00122240 [Aldrovandia affinis]
MCAAIGHHGVIHHHAQLSPYNTARLLTFLDALNNIFIPPQEEGPEQPNYIVIWDNAIRISPPAPAHLCPAAAFRTPVPLPYTDPRDPKVHAKGLI